MLSLIPEQVMCWRLMFMIVLLYFSLMHPFSSSFGRVFLHSNAGSSVIIWWNLYIGRVKRTSHRYHQTRTNILFEVHFNTVFEMRFFVSHYFIFFAITKTFFTIDYYFISPLEECIVYWIVYLYYVFNSWRLHINIQLSITDGGIPAEANQITYPMSLRC